MPILKIRGATHQQIQQWLENSWAVSLHPKGRGLPIIKDNKRPKGDKLINIFVYGVRLRHRRTGKTTNLYKRYDTWGKIHENGKSITGPDQLLNPSPTSTWLLVLCPRTPFYPLLLTSLQLNLWYFFQELESKEKKKITMHVGENITGSNNNATNHRWRQKYARWNKKVRIKNIHQRRIHQGKRTQKWKKNRGSKIESKMNYSSNIPAFNQAETRCM